MKQGMAESVKTFTISFRSLLMDIAQEMKYATPCYHRVYVGCNIAQVVITRDRGPKCYAFTGTNGDISLVESEEEVAQRVVVYFVWKRKVVIDDVNGRRLRLCRRNCAFSSIGGSFDASKYKGIFVFKAHGQVYHNLPDLIPMDQIPRYMQLYFYDGQHEKENRLGLFKELREEVVCLLMDVMDNNPYGRFFRSLREVPIEQNTAILIHSSTKQDQRVYNAPTTEEVAAILPDGLLGDGCDGPHIIAYGRSNKSHRVKHYYGCYDPLQYPLLFPKGECGWHPGLKKIPRIDNADSNSSEFPLDTCLGDNPEEFLEAEASSAKKIRTRADKQISCREYYAHKMQIRPGNVIVRAGRLFQQFIVDMYVKIENTRLDFYRNNQEVIRADLYQGILDTLLLGENNAANVGRIVVLPPSFVGGPRDMRRRYLNAMALVQKFGKPDLFLTMTCNPKWGVFNAELEAGELVQNRPDLVARIFNAKLISLRKQIVERKVFGEVAAIINVVEFQKRGLPHAHFLIILASEFKIKTPDVFDQYVCAEIPPQESVYLRELVLRHMMHGPCGPDFENCPCMKEVNNKKVCKSGYLKRYSEFTTTGSDCYPIYRRRDRGDTATVQRVQMDNRSVIPYNSYLLAMYDCHMNVEVCSTIKAVKYLYKYVYKGHDRISFNVAAGDEPVWVDEIDRFQSGRWISPPEAAWRIFGLRLFDIHPPVLPLAVHKPNSQLVRFRTTENLDTVVADAHRRKTMLTEFFRVNAERPNGPKYLYAEFPEHFVWDSRKKKRNDRKKGGVIGRVAYASPTEGDRYYLRLLLAHVRGPTSFTDLLTTDGVECDTFQESALKRGLLEQDDAIEACMDEASIVQMPHALRRLFSTILIFSTPNCPREFWGKYFDAMSQDFARQYPDKPTKVLQLTVEKVEQYFEAMGKVFRDYGLEELENIQDKSERGIRDINDAINAPVPPECIASRKLLNVRQKAAYKAIVGCVKSGSASAFFVDGPGGTGKTFLYGALYAKVRLLGKICLPTASSGIAASNLPTGRTAHSRFKIPIDSDESLTCDVPKQGGLANLLRETTLIIWDEASMARKENIEAVDLLLKDVCNCSKPFGGKVIVFGGDFRQVLPVLPRRTQREAVHASIVSSVLWPCMQKFSLTENIRAQEDPCFSEFLLSLGNGTLQTVENGFIETPQTIILDSAAQPESLSILIDAVFPEIRALAFSTEIFTERAILTPTNIDVDSINSLLIDKFPGESVTYKSFDDVVDDTCSIYPAEYLNGLCPPGIPPHELSLKRNSPVILLRNLDPSAGLCNGTRLICRKFYKNMIECEISTGFYKGEYVFLPRITLSPSKTTKFAINFRRRQFPIKLSFAMTINKAQGQTLQRVGVYLPRPCFSHGQLYVALSRARSSNKLKVLNATADSYDEACLVKNVVSFDILTKAGIRSSLLHRQVLPDFFSFHAFSIVS